MNKLFNNGDYVLLSDCKAFDKKYSLKEDATMWAVARKMKGGEPFLIYMVKGILDNCVGINTHDNVGCWNSLVEKEFWRKLTVEDVLYRSEDGLTLDELSKIQGAFDEGKDYECVWANKDSCASKGSIYTTNGNGIVIMGITCNRLNLCKFKPITTKHKPWTPSVGEEVMTPWGKVIVKFVKGNQVCVEFCSSINTLPYIEVVQLSHLKPIDKERENTIKKVTDLAETLDDSYTSRDFAIALYDAGMLKINHP